MNARTKTGFIVGLFAVMALLIWLLPSGEEKQKVKGKEPYVSSNWNKAFLEADKHPGGLYLFNLLLRNHVDTNKRIAVLQDSEELDSVMQRFPGNKTFVFVGNSLGLQDSELDTILNLVNEGSDVFLAYNGMTDNILEELFDEYQEHFEYAENIQVYMNGKGHKMYNIYQNDTVAKNWWAYAPNTDAKDSLIGHSSFMEQDNLIELLHGKGSLFLCTNPELFQNIQVKRNDGYQYVTKVIDLLPKDQSVYYLEFARLSDDYGNYDVDDQDGGEGKKDTSYLKVIFENRSLLKAFLFGILGLVVFLLFRSKRMRPEVPYLEPKKDTTKAFMETITSIYFSKRNPYGMLSVQRRNFYAIVQKHFFIDLNRREDERPLIALSEKSDVDINEIRKLIEVLETKDAFAVSDETIATVHKWKQDFYEKTGIVKQHVIDKEERKELLIQRRLFVAVVLLLLGLVALFGGFYLLVAAKGIGIALWPIGIGIVTIAIRQIRKPLLIINENEIVHIPAFGRKRNFVRQDLIRLEWDEASLLLLFTEQRTIRINQSEISRYDKAKLKRLMRQLKIHELW
jgi:hypothetical protein